MNKYDRNILQLAVPSIVTHVTVPLLGLVDLAIVGHVGNETLIGAIAVGSMVFNIMYWLLGFLRMGTTGMTAQSINPSSILHRYLRLALIIAVVIFLVIHAMNKAKEKFAKKEEEEAKEEETPADIALLTEIRDLLKKNA